MTRSISLNYPNKKKYGKEKNIKKTKNNKEQTNHQRSEKKHKGIKKTKKMKTRLHRHSVINPKKMRSIIEEKYHII